MSNINRRVDNIQRRLRRYSERLYAWWWWRSPNRPHLIDPSYIKLLDTVAQGTRGLDLGSRKSIRSSAITLDIVRVTGADVVGDGSKLPFGDETFDYIWCSAVLEHTRYPWLIASEISRTLKSGGLAFIQVPFLENVHGWPDDYYRFTIQGLRVLFDHLEEVTSGVSGGPGQVLPDLIQYYFTLFSDIQGGGVLLNLLPILPGLVTLPLRWFDHLLANRPSYWKWARAYYWVGKRPAL